MAYAITEAVRKDSGPIIYTVTTGIDLTGFDPVSLSFYDPDDSVTTIAGSISGAATLGIITVTTTDGMFDALGYWHAEFVGLDSSSDLYEGDPFVIPVEGSYTD